MLDKPLFHLGGSWWLCFDRHQWVLSVADNPPKTLQEGVLNTAPSRLRALAFVASTKAVLMRVAKEKEIPLTPEASAHIDAMPDTFRQWYRQRPKDDFEGAA